MSHELTDGESHRSTKRHGELGSRCRAGWAFARWCPVFATGLAVVAVVALRDGRLQETVSDRVAFLLLVLLFTTIAELKIPNHIATILLVLRGVLIPLEILSSPVSFDVGLILTLCLAWQAGAHFRAVHGALITAASLAVGVVVYGIYRTEAGPPATFLTCTFGLLAVTMVYALASVLRAHHCTLEAASGEIESLKSTVGDLLSANANYLGYASNAGRRSELAERKRITRELHDSIGQAFTNITAMLETVIRNPLESTTEVTQLHEWIHAQAVDGLSNARASLHRLRDYPSEHQDLAQSLTTVVRAFESAARVHVSIHWGNAPSTFGSTVNYQLRQCILESLVNSYRHGKAREVNVFFRVRHRIVTVAIVDDGRGGPDDAPGIGQLGITERIASVGGVAEFGRLPHGYRVLLTVPLGRTRDPLGTIPRLSS